MIGLQHHKVLSEGLAEVSGKTVPAIYTENLYGQRIVWGNFGHSKGKFKGFLANNANTEGVNFKSSEHEVTYNPPFGTFSESDPIPPIKMPDLSDCSEIVIGAINSTRKRK